MGVKDTGRSSGFRLQTMVTAKLTFCDKGVWVHCGLNVGHLAFDIRLLYRHRFSPPTISQKRRVKVAIQAIQPPKFAKARNAKVLSGLLALLLVGTPGVAIGQFIFPPSRRRNFNSITTADTLLL